ncbi:unnamed protein product [Nezara viridula]|uniref:Chitin-binding type-2 domain-containing protein n=1 Tax=Nezara viridula TaxID=85310 RepID=A0A9P0GZM4_NEZVI|nr:unnamed protein product [Nezara viridula]
MKLWLGALCLVAVGTVCAQGPPRARLSGGLPHGFRVAEDDLSEDLDRNTVTPSLLPRPQQQYRQEPQQRGRPQQDYQQGGRRPPPKQLLKEEELEEEKEEPDKLSLLLPQSKFACDGKNTGYYADEGLNCEVFHYCQDNARHSWICPEGFLFHQVHLICMPPSSDNICTQSSQFHFVNDFLYKPINAEEALTRPNVTIRYSDRYYPENFYEEEISAPVAATPRPRNSPQHLLQQQPQPQPHPHQQHQLQHPQYLSQRPVQIRQPNQVFHSPEEVNIPLQQRRPAQVNQRPGDEFEY